MSASRRRAAIGSHCLCGERSGFFISLVYDSFDSYAPSA
jgi:hypothetical protein